MTSRHVSLILISLLVVMSVSFAETPAGTTITNTAIMNYQDAGGAEYEARSETVQTVVAGRATVFIGKSVSVAEAAPGEIITYTISYGNNGNKAASQVTISDQLPTQLTFVSATNGGVFTNGNVRWNLGILDTGVTGTVQITARVNLGVPSGTIVTNIAVIDSLETDPVNSPPASFTVKGQPNLTITKSGTPNPVLVGSDPGYANEITYTLTYENNGDLQATGVVISDTLPQLTGFSLASNGGTYNPQTRTVSWNVGDLAVGAKGSVQLIVKVDSAAPDGTTIRNIATIRADGGIQVNSNPVDILVYRVPTMEITKELIEDVTIREGEEKEIGYRIKYRNTDSSATARNVVIEDDIPTPVARFANATGTYSIESVGTEISRIKWSVGDLVPGAGGEFRIYITSKSTVKFGDAIVNSGKMRGDNFAPLPFLSPPVTVARGQAPAAKLEIIKTVNMTTADPGDTLLYTLRYRNIGDADAVDVVVEDEIKDWITYVPGTATNGGVFADGKITWELGALPYDGNWYQLSFQAKIDDLIPKPEVFVKNVAAIFQRGVAVEPEKIYSNEVETRVPGNSAGPSVTLVAVPEEILGDGKQQSTLTGTVYVDSILKIPPPVNTKVTLTTSHGRFPNGTQTIDLFTDAQGVVQTQLTGELVGDTYVEALAVCRAITSFGEASDTVKIRFWPAAIRGSIVDYLAGHAPVPGVSVIARDQAMVPVNPGTTDQTGAFNLFLPKPGIYTVSLETVDYLNRSLPLQFDVNAAQAFGKVYYIGNAILGTVTDADTGSPMSNVKVQIRRSTGATVAQATTDQNGVYQVKGLDPDTYVVEVVDAPTGYKSGGPISVSDGVQGRIVLNANIALEKSATVTVTKAVDKQIANKGDLIVYTIAYLNTGGAMSDAELIDELPLNTVFVSASDGVVPQNGVVRWNLGRLDPGDSGDVQLVVRVSDMGPDTFTITNSAVVRLISDPTVQFKSNEVRTDVGTGAVELTKTASAKTVKPGEQVSFTISYRNTGSLNLSDVTITDNLPTGLEYVSATSGASVTGKSIQWTLSKLAVGASGSFTVVARVNETISTEQKLQNLALIAAKYPPVQKQAISEITVLPTNTPVFEFTKTASVVSAKPGDAITYTVSLRNTGKIPATQVIITDTLPGELEYVGAGNFDPVTGRLRIDVGTVAAQSDLLTFQYVARVRSDLSGDVGSITNSAVVTCAEGITMTTFATVKIEPVITVTKTADKVYAASGETVIYTIVSRNSGGTVSSALISDKLPEGLTFVSADPAGTYDDGTRTVTWDLGSMLAGSENTFRVTTKVVGNAVDGLVMKNVAMMSHSGGDVVSNEVVVTVANPRLVVTKTANVAVASPGDQIEYTISFANRGSSDATNVIIVDTLPDELSFVSATGDPQINGKEITWTLDTIPADGSGKFKVVTKAADRLAVDTILNKVSIVSDQTAKQEASLSIDTRIESSLSFTKITDKTKLTAGEVFEYTFQVKNLGPVDARNLVINDVLPADVEFIKSLTGGLTYDSARNIVSYTLPLLAAGQEVTASFRARIRADLDDMKSIQNTATLDTDDVKGQTASVTVFATPVYVRISKRASRRTMEIGDFVTYNLTITNTNEKVKIDNLVLVDQMPSALSYIEGSAEQDGKPVGDPTRSNGNMTWSLGSLEPGQKTELVYRALLDPGLYAGEFTLTNVAWAEGLATKVDPAPAPGTQPIPTKSDEGTWTIAVRRGIFADEGVIIGKVFVDTNSNGFQDPGEKGMPYAKLITDDGAYVITDEFGKYSIPEVRPGYRVIKLAVNELPEGYSVIPSSNRDAGDETSQFVYVMKGGLEKVDFALGYTPQPVTLEAPKPTITQPKAADIPAPQVEQEEVPEPMKVSASAPAIIAPRLDPDTPAYRSPRELWEGQRETVDIGPIRLETAAPVVVAAKEPPEIDVKVTMFQIPPGDPDIIVTVISDKPVKRIEGRRVDGKALTFELKDGKWVSPFIVPFKSPDTPYPFYIDVYDSEGVKWEYLTWVMVDSSIPLIYGEFKPGVVVPGEKTRLYVNLLVEAENVTARIGGKTYKLNQSKRFSWWLDYTVPANTRAGRHAAEIIVTAKEELIKITGIVTYKVRR